jgi:hypothetical protein
MSMRFDPKTPADVTQVGLDFSPLLPPGVTIQTVTLETEPGDLIVTSGPEISGTGVSAWISGGTAGQDYLLRFSIHRSDGGADSRTASIYCGALESAPQWAFASQRDRRGR